MGHLWHDSVIGMFTPSTSNYVPDLLHDVFCGKGTKKVLNKTSSLPASQARDSKCTFSKAL